MSSTRWYASYAAGGIEGRPVSRPYKQQGTPKPPANSNASDLGKTLAQRIAACKARVQAHITRVNADTNIPATVKTAMIQRLTAKLAECSTPHGLGKEENDKEHKDVENIRKGQGQLVRQVTPGALRKNPNVIQSLIDAIWAFFKNIENRPAPVDRFMAKYPQPTTPPATSAVAFGIPGTY